MEYHRVAVGYVNPETAKTLAPLGCPGPGWYYRLDGARPVGPFESQLEAMLMAIASGTEEQDDEQEETRQADALAIESLIEATRKPQ